jgi:hypothetical protein
LKHLFKNRFSQNSKPQNGGFGREWTMIFVGRGEASVKFNILPATTWALFDPKMLAARAGLTIAGAEILLLVKQRRNVQSAVGSGMCDRRADAQRHQKIDERPTKWLVKYSTSPDNKSPVKA